jgi:hypothetical protein
MVYFTQRFKIIPNPSQQDISVGGETNQPSGIGSFDWLINLLQGGQLNPPIQVGVPSTGTGTGGIEEPPGVTSCPSGYALNNQNQCVLIPIGTGVGDITQVEVPSTSNPGGSIIIKTWFKNTHTATLDYKVRVLITALGIDVTSPTISVVSGQTAMIETTIIIPAGTAAGTYSGFVQLSASVVASNALVLQDSEPFTLGVATVVTGGNGGGGTCPTGDISLTVTKKGTRYRKV